MNVKQAAEKWEVSEYQVKKICKKMNLDKKNIPENIAPLYVMDRRYTKNPYRYYIYILDVIINTHMLLDGIDEDVIETCVAELKNAGIIVLKKGRKKNSYDYRDYIISINCEVIKDWKNYKIHEKIQIISPIITAFSEGFSSGMMRKILS